MANVCGMQMSRVVPARRGERTCLCSGILQETRGHYGWILPEQEIDHPEALKHQGSIYLDTRDIRRGAGLCKGDQVMFYLYVDSRGMGAEDCHLKPTPKPVHSGIPLNLADFLDLDDPKKAAGKKLESEGASDTASTASGTGSGASTPRSYKDFESDPILRLLLQPRTMEQGSQSVPSRKLSPERAASSCSSASELPVDVQTECCSEDTMDDADLFALLRAELQEARARAGGLAKKQIEEQSAAAFVPPPGLEGLAPQLPLGFAPPPGLAAPSGLAAPLAAPPGLAAPAGMETTLSPAGVEAPLVPATSEAKEKGFLGWCRRLRMSRFKEACESLM